MKNASYSSTAKLLHWGMAIVMVGLFAFGLYMSSLKLSPEKLKYYSWHKWVGVSLFLLAIARIIWRTFRRPPALPSHMRQTERLLAYFGHGLLYFLMLSIPLSGWLMSSAKGFRTVLFGVMPIPDLLVKNRELGDVLQTVHLTLNVILAVVVIGHAIAALKHHLIDKDDVLIRMLPYGEKF